MAFLRINLLEAIIDHTKPNDPFCAVNIVEAICNDDGSITMQQQKKTFYPDWNRCFDSHLRKGRKMQIIVKDRPDTPVAEVTVETEALANECVDEEAGSAVKLAVSFPRVHPSHYTSLSYCFSLVASFSYLLYEQSISESWLVRIYTACTNVYITHSSCHNSPLPYQSFSKLYMYLFLYCGQRVD